MDPSWTESWLFWAETHPGWLLAIVGLLLFIEGFAVIGLFVPGLLMVFFLGCLIGLGRMELLPVLLTTAGGAFAGDTFNYWLGHHFRDALVRRWPLKKNPDLYARGVSFFQQYGVLSIPLGRFIGPLRSFVPMIAGIMDMRPRTYTSMAALTAAGWVSSLVFPGMLLGASLDIAAAYATRLSLLLSLVVAVLILVIWLARIAYAAISRNAPWILRRMVTWLTRHPHLGRVFSPLFVPAKGEILSIALLGVILLIVLILLTIAIVQLLIGDLGTSLDLRIQAWLLDLRSPITDPFWALMVNFSHWPVLISATLCMTAWLWIYRQPVACLHWALAVLIAPLLALLLQWPLTHLPIWPDHLARTGTFPDIKITLLTATLSSLPMLLVRELSVTYRKWYYLAIVALVSLFIIARMVLDLTYLSAAWTGVLLAISWVALVGIGYRVRVRTGWPVWRHTLFFITCIIVFGSIYSSLEGDDNATRWQPRLTGETITTDAWKTDRWQTLPHYRSSYVRSTREQFNLQYAGNVDSLVAQLKLQNWELIDRGQGNWWQIISPQPDPEQLPLFRKDFRGLPADIVMTRNHPDGRDVLRIWPSGWTIKDNSAKQPLWLGISNQEAIENIGYWFNVWHHQFAISLTELDGISMTRHVSENGLELLLLQALED